MNSDCVAKDSQKSELYQNPVEREDKKGSSSFRCGRKTPENCSRENPRSQVGTENQTELGLQRWKAGKDITTPTREV